MIAAVRHPLTRFVSIRFFSLVLLFHTIGKRPMRIQYTADSKNRQAVNGRLCKIKTRRSGMPKVSTRREAAMRFLVLRGGAAKRTREDFFMQGIKSRRKRCAACDDVAMLYTKDAWRISEMLPAVA
ncbi:MAG: hypothetical protein IJI06_04155 [Oscillospiraceae bacterium]|nr:hypothetical protein [Oscillospiraceae bacterium]